VIPEVRSGWVTGPTGVADISRRRIDQPNLAVDCVSAAVQQTMASGIVAQRRCRACCRHQRHPGHTSRGTSIVACVSTCAAS
jgi:hypothetical protein